MLVAAENPVIICDRLARTPAGMARLVELAETLQCAVVDNAGRMNFPSRHPLNQIVPQQSVISQADVILAIEMNDLLGAARVQRPHRAFDAIHDEEGREDHHARSARHAT